MPATDESWTARRVEADRLLVELKNCTDDDEREKLRQQVIEAELPLVRYLARRFANRNVPLEDLVQVGCIGLIKAVDRFDVGRGVEFSTYAAPTILGAIKLTGKSASGWSLAALGAATAGEWARTERNGAEDRAERHRKE